MKLENAVIAYFGPIVHPQRSWRNAQTKTELAALILIVVSYVSVIIPVLAALCYLGAKAYNFVAAKKVTASDMDLNKLNCDFDDEESHEALVRETEQACKIIEKLYRGGKKAQATTHAIDIKTALTTKQISGDEDALACAQAEAMASALSYVCAVEWEMFDVVGASETFAHMQSLFDKLKESKTLSRIPIYTRIINAVSEKLNCLQHPLTPLDVKSVNEVLLAGTQLLKHLTAEYDVILVPGSLLLKEVDAYEEHVRKLQERINLFHQPFEEAEEY